MSKLSRRRFVAALGGAAASISGCAMIRGDDPQMSIATTTELRSAFDDLSAGDTIRINADYAPYRTTDWLDIDVDDVTVIGPGRGNLIKPEDGANVGGIRIGHNAHCENVTVRGIGYHGNPENQQQAAKRCHGIAVRDAKNVTIQGNEITRTHPYHKHNWGGSGISVERDAREVRIFDNHIHDIGDRGIQLAGEGITVRGNTVVDGFDRSIACDAWSPNNTDYQARNVTITANVLANNPEGSLTGVGGGNPVRSDRGYVVIANNVGYGEHKSLCHVGGQGMVHGIKIDGNVSVQNANNGIAGVVADITRATSVTITNNDLYGYSGHGINIESGIEAFTVANNSVRDSDLGAIRVVEAGGGSVENNAINGSGGAAILLDGAGATTLDGNRIRNVAEEGILTRNGTDGHRIVGNTVADHGLEVGSDTAAIQVNDSANDVRENRIRQSEGPAISEGDAADSNRYVNNYADGTDPWEIAGPASTVTGHEPPFDVHRGLGDGDSDGSVSVSFEKPYDRRPRLTFGRVGGGVTGITYHTDSDGNYDGVTVDIAEKGGTLDVFVGGRS